jgi:hypothetical protein
MYRFRLKSATMAVCQEDGEPHGVAIIIPAGSEIVSVEQIEARAGMDHSTFVSVEWNRKTIRMFLLDLVERGERVQEARG